MTNTTIFEEDDLKMEEGFLSGKLIVTKGIEDIVLSPKELRMIHHAYELYRLKCNYRAD